LGLEAIRRLSELGIPSLYLQIDEQHPTGTVGVTIDEAGEAHFAMNEDSAWDYLEWTDSWKELAVTADAVGFGTMGQRTQQSMSAILNFLRQTRPDATRIFDINLRHAFFNGEMLKCSLEIADLVKLNNNELETIAEMIGLKRGSGENDELLGRRMIDAFNIEILAVTRGPNGSLIMTKDQTEDHPGIKVNVVDTIGSGDAFTAMLAHKYLTGASLKEISDYSNRLGAWVAMQCGATPRIDPDEIDEALRKVE
jgi:fructokinase